MSQDYRDKPLLGASFWFMITVLGLAYGVYQALPMFITPIPPPPQIHVKVEKEMVVEALKEVFPAVTDEWALAGAKAHALLSAKLPEKDVTVNRVLALAREIRPNMVLNKVHKNAPKKEEKTDGKSE